MQLLIIFNGIGIGFPRSFTTEKYEQLDAQLLAELWSYRRSVFPAQGMVGVSAALGYLLLVHSMGCMKKILPKQAATTFMSRAFLLGALVPLWELLDSIGTNGTVNFVSKWPLQPTNIQVIRTLPYCMHFFLFY